MNLFYSNTVSLPYTKPQQELSVIPNIWTPGIQLEETILSAPVNNTAPVSNASEKELLLRILTQANLSDTATNQAIVKELFTNQLPLHRDMILSILRESTLFTEHSIESIVFLHKADIGVTKESLQLLQQYRSHTGGLHQQMSKLGQELLTQVASSPEMPASQIREFLMELTGVTIQESNLNMKEAYPVGNSDNVPLDDCLTDACATDFGKHSSLSSMAETLIKPTSSTPFSVLFSEQELTQFMALLDVDGKVNDGEDASFFGKDTVIEGDKLLKMTNDSLGFSDDSLEFADESYGFTDDSYGFTHDSLGLIGKYMVASENIPTVYSDDTSPEQIIYTVMKRLDSMSTSQRHEVLSSKVLRTLVTQIHINRFLLSPQQVRDSESLEEYYKNLSSHISKMDSLMKGLSPSSSQSNLASQASSTQDNLSMMSQLNQMYTYLQLPLKFQDQISHADLFVLTNKKKQQADSDPLTLLLHLDMDHLGSLDIHIKLLKHHLHANFHVEDSKIASLLEQNFEELTHNLNTLGFQVTLQSTLQEKTSDFLKELKKENQLSFLGNYSFDIRT